MRKMENNDGYKLNFDSILKESNLQSIRDDLSDHSKSL